MAESRGVAAAKKRDEDSVRVVHKESENGHIQTATLCVVLAVVAWYIAVEKPKTDALGVLHSEYLGLKSRLDDLEAKGSQMQSRDGGNHQEAAKLLDDSFHDVRRDLDHRLSSLKAVLDDLQTKQAVDRRMVEQHRQQDNKVVTDLRTMLGKLVQEMMETKGDLDSASRLERAVAALQGRPSAPPLTAEAKNSAQSPPQRNDQPEAKTQAATGGLVELSGQDFSKLLDEGDTWVVMFYAPWCGHCTAAKPEFQQAALQAPVHFAQIDADKFSDVASSQSIEGFPTIRMYSQGKQVGSFTGLRTAVELLEFAQSFPQ